MKQQFSTPTTDPRTAPLKDLYPLANAMRGSDLMELADQIEGEALGLLRRAIYMDARSQGYDHEQAITTMNRKMTAARKALGYSYPKESTRF